MDFVVRVWRCISNPKKMPRKGAKDELNPSIPAKSLLRVSRVSVTDPTFFTNVYSPSRFNRGLSPSDPVAPACLRVQQKERAPHLPTDVSMASAALNFNGLCVPLSPGRA